MKKLEKSRLSLLLQLCGYLLYSSPFARRRAFDPGKVQKVLINLSRPSIGMGDLIQVTPLVEALYSISPNVQIFLLISGAQYSDIVSLFPVKVKIIRMPADYYFYGHRQWLSFVLKCIRPEQFDLVIHQYLEHWLSVSCISLFSGSRRTISYSSHLGREEPLPNNMGTTVLRKSPQDEVPFLYNEELAECLQYGGPWKTSLIVDQDAQRDAEKVLSHFGINSNDMILGIHPGCSMSQSFRRWPADKFVETAKRFCKEFNGKVLVFGGPEEEAEMPDIKRRLKDKVHFITGCDIKRVSSLIKRCSIFLTNDSGLMHISLAAGVPTVAVYGPTRPEKFDGLYNDEKFVRLRGNVSCPPCLGTRQVKRCGSDVPDCIMAVPVDEVYDTLKNLISSPKCCINQAGVLAV